MPIPILGRFVEKKRTEQGTALRESPVLSLIAFEFYKITLI